MAIDFVHTTEIVDAVIAALKGYDGTASHTGGLPVSWFAPIQTGTGLSDLTFAGTGTGGVFTVEIVTGGATSPNTFKWRKGTGTWSSAVNCATSATTLSDGVTVAFGAIVGHTAGNSWAYDSTDVPLTLLEHGDLADYPMHVDVLDDLSPAIIVRGLGPKPSARGGQGGHNETREMVRVIHVRSWEHTRSATGAQETNLTRGRERYAKILGAALFHDPKRKLARIATDGTRYPATLTSADGAGAQLTSVRWEGWDFGEDLGSAYSMPEVAIIRELRHPLWCIGCELSVVVDTGGQG